MLPSDALFTADAADRWLQPRPGRPIADPRRYLAFVGAFVVYALVLLLLVFENGFEPVVPPAPEEIPVEIIAEPTPPPPAPAPTPPPTPPPPAAEQPLDEKPATDAPRAANVEKIEREAPDPVTKAPPAPPLVKPPGQEGEVDKGGAEKPEPDPAPKENSAEPAKEKADVEPDPTGELKREAPDPPQRRAELETPPQPSAPSVGSRIPMFDTVPDVDFGSFARAAPVAGGNAKATYFSILYGMIVPRVRWPSGARLKSDRGHGAIVFGVDARGNLTQRWIAQSSGWPELDNAAFEAVGRASPFPPPPRGAPLVVTFTFSDHR